MPRSLDRIQKHCDLQHDRDLYTSYTLQPTEYLTQTSFIRFTVRTHELSLSSYIVVGVLPFQRAHFRLREAGGIRA